MKFYGTPNMSLRMTYRINNVIKTKPIGRFDNNGIYETDDEKIIKKMKRKFKFDKEVIEIKEEVKPNRHCKKCDFTCETQGELLRHYREVHPKKED